MGVGAFELAVAAMDVLVWGFAVLIAFALGVVILFAILVRMDWPDTVWHNVGRYLRWRKRGR